MKYLRQFNEAKKIWTKEECNKESIKYTSRNEFHLKSSSAYLSALKNGWLDEVCSHMVPLRKYKGYWTKEKCQELSLKYNSRSEFEKNENGAYAKAQRNGWLKDICSHMSYLGNRVRRFVYMYTFPDKAVYIGLTSDFNRRNLSHTTDNIDNTSNSRRVSPVYKYMKLTGLIPTSELLTPEPIALDDAVKMEIRLIKEFRDNKYNVLNTSNGGDVGGSYLMWTKEKCQEEALKYKTIKDFMNGSPGAVGSARKNGWWKELSKDFDKVIKDFYWTKERCREEALKYDHLTIEG